MIGDGYADLLTSLVDSPNLDALVERYTSHHTDGPPAAWVDVAHYNAGVRMERCNAGLA
jgi:hypothetical protein